ncbi:hypothetical protein HNP40_001397 [Mycobacteroides chelonae]|nr:hypothetical protein [Mycobacteroides chelonae]
MTSGHLLPVLAGSIYVNPDGSLIRTSYPTER